MMGHKERQKEILEFSRPHNLTQPAPLGETHLDAGGLSNQEVLNSASTRVARRSDEQTDQNRLDCMQNRLDRLDEKNIGLSYRVRTCFCLSEVREYWLLIYSSNLSKSAYNFYTCKQYNHCRFFQYNLFISDISIFGKNWDSQYQGLKTKS